MKSNPTSLTWLKRPSIILPCLPLKLHLKPDPFFSIQCIGRVRASNVSCSLASLSRGLHLLYIFLCRLFYPLQISLISSPTPSLPDCPYPPFGSFQCCFLWEAFLMPQLRLTPLLGVPSKLVTPCGGCLCITQLHWIVPSIFSCHAMWQVGSSPVGNRTCAPCIGSMES